MIKWVNAAPLELFQREKIPFNDFSGILSTTSLAWTTKRPRVHPFHIICYDMKGSYKFITLNFCFFRRLTDSLTESVLFKAKKTVFERKVCVAIATSDIGLERERETARERQRG